MLFRSIAGLHLRDALDLLDRRAPGMLLRFGGHAAAAGVTIKAADFERFATLFEQVVRELVGPVALAHTLETDGPLSTSYMSLDTVRLLDAQIWGQGFPQPLFCDRFAVRAQRLVADKHMKVRLDAGGRLGDAMKFNATAPLPAAIQAAYRLTMDE